MHPDRQALKQKLFNVIQPLQTAKRGSPLTNRTLAADTCGQIEQPDFSRYLFGSAILRDLTTLKA